MAGTLLNSTTFNDTNANDQMNATLSKDGLLMRMAKTKGQQAAGSRGLMNSSIGSEASMRAMVDAATPIAQKNTQFAQSRNLNQQQADLTAKRDATQQQYNKDNMAAQFDYSTKLNDQQNQFTASQNALDRAQQIKMQDLQYKNQLGLLDAQGKQELERLQQQFKNQYALNDQQNTFTASQSALDRAQQVKLQDDQQSFTAGQSELDRAQQIKMQDLQYKNQLGLLDAQGKQELAQMQAQFGYTTQLNNQQNTFAASQSALDRQQQTNLTNLNFQNQSKLNTQQNQATTARDAALFGYDQNNKATDFANSLKTMSEQQKNDLAKLNNQNAQQTALAAQQQQYALTNTAKQVAANTQGMYLDAINGLTSTFGDQVAAINASSMKASDKTNSINSLISAQNSMLKFYQSTYQNMSTIKDDWVNVDVNTLPTGSIAQLK